MKTTMPFLLFTIFLLSCKYDHNNRQVVLIDQANHSISNADTLLTDTTWYDHYKADYEKTSYETLDDAYLKQVLEKHFVLDDDKTFPTYCYEYNGTAIKDSAYIFSGEGKAADYRVSIMVKRFDSLQHHYTYTNTGFLYLVDHKIFWGTDGNLPGQETDTMTVLYKGKPIDLPASEYKDLYNLYPTKYRPMQVSVDKKNGNIYVIVYGSDGAGSYTCVWIFRDGKYIKRVVEGSC